MVVGVGIGGTFDSVHILAKESTTRKCRRPSPVPYVNELEKERLEKINKLGIGPGGLAAHRQHLP